MAQIPRIATESSDSTPFSIISRLNPEGVFIPQQENLFASDKYMIYVIIYTIFQE
jgi:hypothetical protein